jgi:transposase
VVGIVERKGRVIARATPDATGATLLPLVRDYILPESTVYTDEYKAYGGIESINKPDGSNAGYIHRRVNHSARIYVHGDVHTNSVEGFWSLLKRGIGGVYHQVSQKFLQNYLDEYSFRYNHRFDTEPMFLTFLRQIAKAESADSPSSEPLRNPLS